MEHVDKELKKYPLKTNVFLHQILNQCEYVILSCNSINEHSKTYNIGPLFFNIQNFLTSSANISKLLWGSGGRSKDSRKYLRDLIGISDCSPLRDVVMRNNFEHMDERVDQWWRKSSEKTYSDRLICDMKIIISEDIDKFRMFDPITWDINFGGQSFNVSLIFKEIEALVPNIINILQTYTVFPVFPEKSANDQ